MGQLTDAVARLAEEMRCGFKRMDGRFDHVERSMDKGFGILKGIYGYMGIYQLNREAMQGDAEAEASLEAILALIDPQGGDAD